jgi:hypothetical protein
VKRVVALLALAACAPNAVAIESRCHCTPPAPPSCDRARWRTLLAAAVARSERAAAITPAESAAIVEWYCVREAARPRSDLLWLGTETNEVAEADFWRSAKASSFDLANDSVISRSTDRAGFPYELARRPHITRVTLDVIPRPHDPGPIPIRIHYYFRSGDELVVVDLAAGTDDM